MEFIEYNSKKLYKGMVSVQSQVVERAVSNKKGLIIRYLDEKMTVLPEKVSSGKKFPFPFQGANGNIYFLINFIWKPDVPDKQQRLL